VIALLWLATAFAQDFVRTSAGATAGWAPQAAASDVDLLVGERFRITAIDGDDFALRLLADARFTVDPDGEPTLEYHRVSQLGTSLDGQSWRLDLGRHPVRHGGPRLVDGAQVLFEPGDFEVGGWAGLAPDLFTTLPRLRPGGGPILGWSRSQLGATVVGEVVFADTGEVDRAGVLATARASRDRLLDLFSRVDMELAGPAEPHLADAQALVLIRPWTTTRFDLLYNAFSSLRYQRTAALDPTLQRFEQRLLDLGLQLGIQQDTVDPTINHLVGGGARWRSPSADLTPFFGATGRYRHHLNPLNRYARLTPHVGIGMPAAGWLELTTDANYIEVDGTRRGDGGLGAFWDPADSIVGLDSSARVLINPRDYEGAPGFYADLFADIWLPADLVAVAGVSVLTEPVEDFADTSLGAFLRVTHNFRPTTASGSSL